MTWVAVAIGGSALISGAVGASSASKAASAQERSAQLAADTQLQMFNTVNDQQAPYRQAGTAALSKLSDLLGIGSTKELPQGVTPYTFDEWTQRGNYGGSAWPNSGVTGGNYSPQERYQQYLNSIKVDTPTPQTTDTGTLLKPFSAQDLSQWQDPGYQFRLQQGLGAMQNSAAGTSGLVSGNSLRSLMDYGQNSASQEYQNAFNRYNTNQTNIYNRLSNIAGLGQTAANTSGQLGMTAAGNIGSAQMAGGAAQAAGYIGAGNAINSGINNAMGWYLGNKYLNSQATTPTPQTYTT